MSIVRFGSDGSDVYVYESGRGLECCGCWLDTESSPYFETADEMIDHLTLHVAAGHHVPPYVFDELVDYVIGE